MDMLSPGSGLNLLDKKWRIYGRTPTCPPTYIGAQGDVGNSAIAKGCTVLGEVKNSVLSTGTCVDEGAEVSYSVVMPGAVIGNGRQGILRHHRRGLPHRRERRGRRRAGQRGL